MISLPPNIRRANLADHSNIASLLHQLGYETPPTRILANLTHIRDSSTDLVLVVVEKHGIIGCISLHILPLFHTVGFLGRVTSLVIDESYRGQRIGIALMDAATCWFSANGCVKMEVTSGDHRLDAHRFYESYGMAREGQRFAKSITPQRTTD